MHPNNLSFTIKLENNNKLNFLDLNISKANYEFTFKIYQKNKNDLSIHVSSHHPPEQKLAAYNSFTHRLLTTSMTNIDYN